MHVIDATANYPKALQQCLAALRRGGETSLGDRGDRTAPALDKKTVEDAKARLAGILGPIARLLVDKACDRAKSGPELFRLVALHIDDDAERERFLASSGTGDSRGSSAAVPVDEASGALGAAEVAAAARSLARYLGPIAPVLARREAKGCGSLDQLGERLAGLIPDQAERDEFLRELGRD